MNKILAYDYISRAADQLAIKLPQLNTLQRLYGVPRGGVCAALALATSVGRLYHKELILVDHPTDADLIIDDLVDSGATFRRYCDLYEKPFAALFKKGDESTPADFLWGTVLPVNEWITFPWEGDAEHSADDIPKRLLQFIGEDCKRGGLLETPQRFIKAWKEWTSGYGVDPAVVLKTFEDGAACYDELILVKDIPVYSKCEHHLADIFGVAHIGYIPKGKIVGLSKLSRLVDVFARRLQVQERLTVQIADALQENLNPIGIAVVLECRHACMESRGINKAGTTTITSAMRGAMLTKPEARAEFFSMINGGRHV